VSRLWPRGNRVDVTTVEQIVGTMEVRFGIAGRVWVMDRGMTSAANIAWLQRTGRRYLIGTPKSDLKKFAAQADRRRTRLADRARGRRGQALRRTRQQRDVRARALRTTA
jgi:hypothetical protein